MENLTIPKPTSRDWYTEKSKNGIKAWLAEMPQAGRFALMLGSIVMLGMAFVVTLLHHNYPDVFVLELLGLLVTGVITSLGAYIISNYFEFMIALQRSLPPIDNFHLANQIGNAKNRVCIYVTCLLPLSSENSEISDDVRTSWKRNLMKACQTEKSIEMKFLILDPDSPAVTSRQSDIAKSSSDIQSIIKQNIWTLNTLKYYNNCPTLTVRLYKNAPSLFVFHIDTEYSFGPYLPTKWLHQTERYKTDESLQLSRMPAELIEKSWEGSINNSAENYFGITLKRKDKKIWFPYLHSDKHHYVVWIEDKGADKYYAEFDALCKDHPKYVASVECTLDDFSIVEASQSVKSEFEGIQTLSLTLLNKNNWPYCKWLNRDGTEVHNGAPERALEKIFGTKVKIHRMMQLS